MGGPWVVMGSVGEGANVAKTDFSDQDVIKLKCKVNKETRDL